MRHLNRCLVITSLLFTVLTVEAIQLGSVKGSVVFGRPLDLSVQVRLDAPAEEATNCFSAEVFQADNKFDAGRVRLDVTPAANGLDATVRVRSATAVNEPWAKVILRSNCGAKMSRQYDFLTDFATDTPAGNMLAETLPTTNTQAAANATIAEAPVSNWRVNRSQERSQERSQAKAKASQQKPDTQTSKAPLTSKNVKPMTPTTAVAALGTKKTTDMVTDAFGQSRLKMETFELTNEHQVLLKLSTALVAPTGMRTPEEIQALAQATAVWRAINGMPAEVKATETPAADVLAQAKATVQAPPATIPTLMNEKLANKSEFSNLMVYGLIGLLALTLACIAWLWLRVRKASRAGYEWLNDSMTEDDFVEHEPTQFLHTHFYENDAATPSQELQEPIDTVEKLEPAFETETEVKETLGTAATTDADADADKIFIEVVEGEKPHASSVSIANNQIVSSLPPHFDDPRFDEHVLQTKKKNRDAVHDQPIVSSAELMALVLADSPPKLRSVSPPAPVLDDKASDTKVAKTTPNKDETKGNLIDFDVFAESEPLNKPTRFVR